MTHWNKFYCNLRTALQIPMERLLHMPLEWPSLPLALLNPKSPYCCNSRTCSSKICLHSQFKVSIAFNVSHSTNSLHLVTTLYYPWHIHSNALLAGQCKHVSPICLIPILHLQSLLDYALRMPCHASISHLGNVRLCCTLISHYNMPFLLLTWHICTKPCNMC